MMKCLGRTKSTNFLRRCKNDTKLFFCKNHIWQPFTLLFGILAILASVAEFTGISLVDITSASSQEKSEVVVYIAAPYNFGEKPKSDFKLDRGGATALYFHIPKISQPTNRIVFSRLFVRPVNYGSESINNLTFSIGYSKDLWLSKAVSSSISELTTPFGKHDFSLKTIEANGLFIVAGSLPRLDPLAGLPIPFPLRIEFSSTQTGSIPSSGKIKIMLAAPNWKGLSHTLEIHCVPAETADEFLKKTKALVEATKKNGMADVPVIMVATGSKSYTIAGLPSVIEAWAHTFVGFE